MEDRKPRQSILIVAERLFAEYGYAATKFSDVVREAGVSRTLAIHYFVNKEVLYREVVKARLPEWRSHVGSLLKSASSKPDCSIEDLLRAFFGGLLMFLTDKGDGWRNHFRIIGRSLSNDGGDLAYPTLDELAAVPDMFHAYIDAFYGTESRSRMRLAHYLFEAALLFIIQDKGLLNLRTEGAYSVNRMDEILEEMVTFFGAGFEASAKRPAK